MKKKILILGFTNHARDPRINRQIMALKDEYDLTTVGVASSGVEGVKFIVKEPVQGTDKKGMAKIFTRAYMIKKLRRITYVLGRFEKYAELSGHLSPLKDITDKYDLIIANDVETMPLAVAAANGAKIILDAHEYSPREMDECSKWRKNVQAFNLYLCRKYIKRSDAMVTVCDSIAQEYRIVYGITPVTVTNASPYQDLQPVQVGDKVKMIHHGGACRARKLEKMIELMDYLDNRYTLDFMLVHDEEYIVELREMAKNNSRINFIEPVPMKEIVNFTNKYDIGVYMLEPQNFNQQKALPNKFFEFVQSRLALAIGPSEEMVKLIDKYKCGIYSDSFDPKDLAKKLNNLTNEQIQELKNNSHIAAKELNAENNLKVLKNLIKNLIG